MLDIRSHPTAVFEYDRAEFPFAEAIAAVLGLTAGAAALPGMRAGHHEALVTRETDQHLIWHRTYYGQMDRMGDEALALLGMYDRFVRTWVSPLYGERLVYQAMPSFRVHLPGNLAVGKFHTDGDFGHSTQEYNWWLPFTETIPENTVWIQDGPFDELTPMLLNHGEILTFDAVRKQHGNITNRTEKARVSWDFRVVPVSQWNPDVYTSTAINTGTKFAIGPGHYFKEMHK